MGFLENERTAANRIPRAFQHLKQLPKHLVIVVDDQTLSIL